MKLVYYDHAEELIKLLPPRLRTGNYAKILRIFATRLNDYEAALYELGRAYSLVSSSTPLFMLVIIARRFGLVLPPGFEKSDYRVFIRAQAAAVLSSGTWPQVQMVADLLRPDGTESRARVHRQPPDHLTIEIPGLPDNYATMAKEILRRAIRAQDSFDLVSYPSNAFTFDFGPGFDVGQLAKLL